ncbi:MAG TPA: haloacid dehalogenase [Ktedonobacter sp.]|nr:haloacid dehalogenase [Ktedonobacter sp.]
MSTLVFLIDVDNTLLDNDSVKKDYDAHLQVELGPKLTERFWDLYEQVRHEKSVIDIPETLKLLRQETSLSELDEQTYQHVVSIFDNYPFYNALYPQTLETLRYLGTLGTTVIVSDGDLIFQAEKITSSHIADEVQGRVLLYTHKQEHIDEITKQYPADHYTMIDDKPDILLDMKKVLADKLTTVFVRQGKYANASLPEDFQPDIIVDHIADLQHYNASQFLSVKR